MKKWNAKNCPLEAVEQENLFKWAAKNKERIPELKWLNCSLNGVRLSPGLRVKAKKSGMKAGFPDINLPISTDKYNGLYIELKRIRGGQTSEVQKEWLRALNNQGYKAVVCNGFERAKSTILEYLGR